MKEERIKMLKECMDNIKKIQENYIEDYPGCILSEAAYAYINSLHNLETKANFSDEKLGVKNG